jgi:hypothetical protein
MYSILISIDVVVIRLVGYAPRSLCNNLYYLILCVRFAVCGMRFDNFEKLYTNNIFDIQKQSKIAQFIFEKASTPYVQTVSSLPSSSCTGGFGSTDQPTSPQPRFTCYKINSDETLVIDTQNEMHYRVRNATLVENNQQPTSDIIVTNLHKNKSKQTPNNILQLANHPIANSNNIISPSTSSLPLPPSLTAVPAATPKSTMMTNEVLLQSIGYRKLPILKKYLKSSSNKSLKIQKDVNPTIPPGQTATMNSTRRNTTPLPIPQNIGDAWHLDIGYGPKAAIGGIKYTLLAVDRHSRYKLVYGLKNLQGSHLSAIKMFLRDCGPKPKLLRTDFNQKIMGGDVTALLLDNEIPIQSSPPYHQHRNGLVERHWQEMVAMTRNWITQSLLPSEFWCFGIKRACEVSNLLPTTHLDTKTTTPFELMFKKPADYRQLFPLFSTAYIKQVRTQGTNKSKWKSQSLKCIAVGRCPKSDGILFYHPLSKQTLTCGDGFKLDTFSPSGL